METNYTHIVRYVQESIGGAKTRSELQQTAGTVQSITDKFGTFAGATRVISAQTRNAANEIVNVKTGFDAAGNAIGQTTTTVKAASSQMGDFERAMRRALIVAPVWMILRAAMMAVLQAIQTQIKFLIELETAMTRIKIVGKGTAEEYKNLQDSLIALSRAYGTSAKDAIEAAQIFAQQGKSVSETLILTQQAMLAAQILGKDVKTTVEDLTAAMKAFNISAIQSTSVIDRWINVEKNFAVTSKDLAEATKVAGATANQLGISISEFLGDVTAIIEVTRKSGSEAARGLSFIYARLFTTAQKTIQQVAQVKFYLDEQGKATNSLTGILRPASDVLSELAIKWNTLTKEEKLEIAASLGSKRQMTVVNALMQNYTHSIDARIAALTSAGQAESAFNLIQETTAFKLKQVESSWNAVTVALTDTSGIKAAIDGINNFLINLTYLISAEKGYRAAIASQIAQQKMQIDSQTSAAVSIKEIIDLRDKLLTAPQSDETNKRIATLNSAIDSLAEKNPEIKVALEVKDTKALDEAIANIQRDAIRKKVILDVQLKYQPLIVEAENQLNSATAKLTGTRSIFEQKLLRLYKDQTKEIENQYKVALADYEVKRGKVDISDGELSNITKLTRKEEEQLDIATKISTFNLQNKDDKLAQLNYEIELVKSSKEQYDAHDKLLKTQQLQKSIAEEQVRLKEQEKKYSMDLYLQTAKLKGITDSSRSLAEAALTRSLYGEAALRNDLSLRLKLEERITKEKLNQVEISDDTVKLFKISQKEGIEVARQLGSFLTGQIDYTRLKEMPRVFAAFQQYFSDRFEQMQAASFFGVPFRGNGTLGGARQYAPGYTVPVAEFEAMRNLPKIANIPTSTTISGLNLNVEVSTIEGKTKEEKAKNLQISIAEAIKTDPEVQKAISERIEEF